MSSLEPRAVLVTRQPDYDRLLAAHATKGQTEFFLRQRGQSMKSVAAHKERQTAAVAATRRAIPDEWRIAEVLRDDLDRFLFSDGDIVIAIGQDGLVANLAKYLSGQPVIGITPDPEETEGVLTPLTVDLLPRLLPKTAAGDINLQRRTMVQAQLDDGQKLTALNELFIGHCSHQSARYVIQFETQKEYQSSSGVIVSTGTGLTGWARSIMTATQRHTEFAPDDPRAAYFTREPWPSRTSGCDLAFGELMPDKDVILISRMNEGGVIFADGIERDFLPFNWGSLVKVGLTTTTLDLVLAD